MQQSTKDREFLQNWSDRWHSGNAKWHEKEIDKHLQKYFGRIRKLKNKDEIFKVFVPLCGKTLDIKWLLDQGCRVVGVEGVKTAIEDLFQAHSLTYSITPLQNDDSLFEGKELPLKVYHCNIFEFPKYNNDNFDFIWDRGSFVAINNEQRERYVSLVKKLHAPKFYHLLESYHYETDTFNGTPRNLPFDMLKNLMGDDFNYEHLETVDMKKFYEDRYETEFKFFNLLIFLIYRKTN